MLARKPATPYGKMPHWKVWQNALYCIFVIYGKAFAVQGTKKARNEEEDWITLLLLSYILYIIVYICIKLNRHTGDA